MPNTEAAAHHQEEGSSGESVPHPLLCRALPGTRQLMCRWMRLCSRLLWSACGRQGTSKGNWSRSVQPTHCCSLKVWRVQLLLLGCALPLWHDLCLCLFFSFLPLVWPSLASLPHLGCMLLCSMKPSAAPCVCHQGNGEHCSYSGSQLLNQQADPIHSTSPCGPLFLANWPASPSEAWTSQSSCLLEKWNALPCCALTLLLSKPYKPSQTQGDTLLCALLES